MLKYYVGSSIRNVDGGSILPEETSKWSGRNKKGEIITGETHLRKGVRIAGLITNIQVPSSY